MKALTVWQPWATLWACGAKEFETRGWATSYRGPIAIHAAQKDVYSVMRDMPVKPMTAVFQALQAYYGIHGGVQKKLSETQGCVIATAELVGCHKMVLHGGRGMSSSSPGWLETDRGIYEPSEQELLFGDWTPGRYAWELRNVKMLDTPVPAKGKQRIWEWEEK